MYEELKGRVVLVTGGSRGIGRGIVEQLAMQGAQVVFTYRGQQNLAEDVAATLRSQGYWCRAVQADVADSEASRALVENIEQDWGPIYGLVNNAGITADKSFLTMPAELWHQVIDTNLTGTALLTQAVLQQMMYRKEGRVVMMASVGGLRASSGQANYSATKAGLIALTRTLSHEVARFNILVNAVAPGFIATEMTSAMPEAAQAAIPKQVPLRRMGSVKEIAAPVLFLLSNQASYITGHCLVIDGGLTA